MKYIFLATTLIFLYLWLTTRNDKKHEREVSLDLARKLILAESRVRKAIEIAESIMAGTITYAEGMNRFKKLRESVYGSQKLNRG